MRRSSGLAKNVSMSSQYLVNRLSIKTPWKSPKTSQYSGIEVSITSGVLSRCSCERSEITRFSSLQIAPQMLSFSGIDRSFPHQARDGLSSHQEDTGRNLPQDWSSQGNLVRKWPYFRYQGKPGCGQVFRGRLEITLYLQTSKFRTGRVNR